MGVTFTPFVDGDTMSPGAVRTELEAAYEFVGGGIAAGDIVKNTFSSEHIYRPDFTPWPTLIAVGVKQSAGGGPPLVADELEHRYKTRRFDIYPRPPPTGWGGRTGAALDVGERLPVPGTQRTIWTGNANGYLVYRVHWSCQVVDFTSAPAHAGYFQVAFRRRSAPTVITRLGATRRNMYIDQNGTGYQRGQCSWSTIAQTSTYAGEWYDVWLEYARDNCAAGVHQLAIGYAQASIAHHVTG